MQPSKLILGLFCTSANRNAALQNLHKALKGLPPDQLELTVIDIGKDPQEAERSNILATPTLVRFGPAPRAILVGDLTDMHTVRKLLLGPLEHAELCVVYEDESEEALFVDAALSSTLWEVCATHQKAPIDDWRFRWKSST